MKKTLVLLPILAISSISYALTDEQIARYATAAGRYLGAGAGTITGFFAGKEGLRKAGDWAYSKTKGNTQEEIARLSKPSVENPFTDEKIAPIDIYGGAYGGVLGYQAGGYLGEQLGLEGTALYFSKKYGVPRRIALAATVSQKSLAQPAVRQIFFDAQNKNNDALRNFLTAYYEEIFGKNWRQDLNTCLNFMNMNFFERRKFTKNDLFNKFLKTLPLTNALSDLYFNVKISIADNIAFLPKTKQLYEAIFSN